MAQHRTFGATRCPRSVQDRSEVIRRPLRISKRCVLTGCPLCQGAVAPRPEGKERYHHGRRNRAQNLGVRGIAYRDRGLRIAQEILQFSGGIGGVERQKEGAGPNTGQIERQRLHRFRRLHRDAVAGLDARLNQKVRDLARALVELCA